MSIASEIQDLNTNLTAAKNAVTTKGGTVGDTGLAGLAAEIASIPSGGGVTSYGTIKYTENGVDKTVEMATEDDFIELTLGGSGAIIVVNNASINKNWIKEIIVGDGVQYLPDQFAYGCPNLTKVTLPDSLHYIGSKCFYYCTSLNSTLNLSKVVFIGTEFLSGCSSFNQPISLPKIDEVGSYFMSPCTSFNSTITLNDNMLLIGERFLAGCTSFAQPLTIPSGLLDTSAVTVNPGQRFMNNCSSFTGPLVCTTSTKIPTDNYSLSANSSAAIMYTTGVTLTGPYATQWKAALPDRTTGPYRKLIVAS